MTKAKKTVKKTRAKKVSRMVFPQSGCGIPDKFIYGSPQKAFIVKDLIALLQELPKDLPVQAGLGDQWDGVKVVATNVGMLDLGLAAFIAIDAIGPEDYDDEVED